MSTPEPLDPAASSDVAAIMAKAERNYKRYSWTMLIAAIVAGVLLLATLGLATVAGDPHGGLRVAAKVVDLPILVAVWAYANTLAERIRILECLTILQGRR